jgi:hypothetical protein
MTQTSTRKTKTIKRGGGLWTNHTNEMLHAVIKNATEDELKKIYKIWNIVEPTILNREQKNTFLFNRLHDHTSFFNFYSMLTSVYGVYYVYSFLQIQNANPNNQVDMINSNIYNVLLLPFMLAAAAKLGMSVIDKTKSIMTSKVFDSIILRQEMQAYLKKNTHKGGGFTTRYEPDLLNKLIHNATNDELNDLATIWDIKLKDTFDRLHKNELVLNRLQKNELFNSILGVISVAGTAAALYYLQHTTFNDLLLKLNQTSPYFVLSIPYVLSNGPYALSLLTHQVLPFSDKLKSIKTVKILDNIMLKLEVKIKPQRTVKKAT